MSRKDNDSAASGGRVAAHILAFVGVTLLAVVILLVAAGLMLKFGPSPAAGERFGELAAEKGAPAFISERRKRRRRQMPRSRRQTRSSLRTRPRRRR